MPRIASQNLENISKSSQSSSTFKVQKKGTPLYQIAPDKISSSTSSNPEQRILSKPLLPSPGKERTVPEYGLITSLNALHGVAEKQLPKHMEALKKHDQKNRELILELSKGIETRAKHAKEENWWSTAKKVASCILAGLTTVFGIALFAAGGEVVIGALLLTAGILTLANLAFEEFGIWNRIAEAIFPNDQDKQKLFLNIVPAAVGLAAAAIGIAGTAGVFFWTSLAQAKQIILVMNSASAFAQGITSIGGGLSQRKNLLDQADLKRLDLEFLHQELNLERITKAMEKVMQLLTETFKKASRIIKLSSQVSQEITLQG